MFILAACSLIYQLANTKEMKISMMMVRSLVGPELVPYMVMRKVPINFAKIAP
jgi:hypothetical protein